MNFNLSHKKIVGLDVLRGLCGYAVAICHYLLLIKQIHYFEHLSILFVEFFFILSGFVLAPQIIKIIKNKNFISIFLIRRWMRTLPLYFFALTIVSIITSNLFSIDFFYYLFFFNKLLPNLINNDYYAVAWSLAIEEFFYFLFAITIFFFFNIKNFIKKTFFILFFLNCLNLLFCFFVDLNFLRTSTLLRIDTILLGFLLAIYIQKIKINLINIILFQLTLIIIFFIFYKLHYYSNMNSIQNFIFVNLLKVMSIMTVYIFAKINFSSKLRMIFEFLANQTYSVYLLHLPIIYIINSSEIFNINLWEYILLLFTLSTVVYYFFEKPILSLRPKYEKN
jgi:peptidoglycan/LPS O-acetylase OafA/YrhL